MTGRTMFNAGFNAGARAGIAAVLLVAGLRCQGDPLYLGPIEITGSVVSPPDDAGGGSAPADAALVDGGADADAAGEGGAADADAADASAVCMIPISEP